MPQLNGNAKATAFLAAYKLTASITKASAAAKIDRALHYQWLKTSEGYRQAFALAKTEAAQVLEDEAVRRATEGVKEPIFYQGRPVGVIQRYSDGLMQFLLRGFLPDKYSQRVSAELSGPGGGPIPVTNPGLATLTDDELVGLIAVTQKLERAERLAGRTPAAAPAEN